MARGLGQACPAATSFLAMALAVSRTNRPNHSDRPAFDRQGRGGADIAGRRKSQGNSVRVVHVCCSHGGGAGGALVLAGAGADLAGLEGCCLLSPPGGSVGWGPLASGGTRGNAKGGSGSVRARFGLGSGAAPEAVLNLQREEIEACGNAVMLPAPAPGSLSTRSNGDFPAQGTFGSSWVPLLVVDAHLPISGAPVSPRGRVGSPWGT